MRRVALAAALALAACRTAAPERPSAAPPAPAAPPPIDLSALDRTVSPCDDFYRFACGGWLARTEIPADRPRWARGFDVLGEANLAQLRELAEADAAGRLDPADRYADKVGAYYAACMDEQGVEARGLDELRGDWARIDAASDPTALGVELARLHERGTWPLFQVGSEQDARDATQVIGVVAQGGLSLPEREYYLSDDPRMKEIRAAYVDHVARMLALAGVPDVAAREQAAAILALEARLAEAQWSRVEMRDPQRRYNRLELAGLEREAPRFPWRRYLEALGASGVTAFSTTTPKYLERVNQLLGEVPPATWQAYLRWKLLARSAGARTIPRRFVDEAFRFSSRYFSGAKELSPRWKHCVRATQGALGEAIGQAWVRRHFAGDAKERTQALVSGVEGAMGRTLAAIPWMDDATRARAVRKLKAVANQIGYPDSWRKYDALRVDRGSFYRSAAAGDAFELHRDLSKIGKPVDRGEWEMPPAIVNAYYSPSLNQMVFPAGILQPPFYARAWTDAANFGAIGMAMGHELTHGFDDSGRQYDGAGNLVDWWTPAVALEFERRAACVARQFGAYPVVEGEPDRLNGQLTLGENIADLGGLKLAFAAYRASRAGGPAATIEGFDVDQAFFVASAQMWCTKVRPEMARVAARTDPHAPARWRVNGPLSNTPEFAAAFRCAAGSPMVRADRCEVW